MKSTFAVLGLVVFLLAALLTTGCDTPWAKKSAKAALEDLKALKAVAKVGVTVNDYGTAYEKAKVSSGIALGKLNEGELRTALMEAIEGYTDGKKVLENPGQIDTYVAPYKGYITKYGFKAPSQFVLQFGLLQKIFDKTGKGITALEDLLR